MIAHLEDVATEQHKMLPSLSNIMKQGANTNNNTTNNPPPRSSTLKPAPQKDRPPVQSTSVSQTNAMALSFDSFLRNSEKTAAIKRVAKHIGSKLSSLATEGKSLEDMLKLLKNTQADLETSNKTKRRFFTKKLNNTLGEVSIPEDMRIPEHSNDITESLKECISFLQDQIESQARQTAVLPGTTSSNTTSTSSSTASAIPQRQMDAGAVAPTTQPASTPDRQLELQAFIVKAIRDERNKTAGITHQMPEKSPPVQSTSVSQTSITPLVLTPQKMPKKRLGTFIYLSVYNKLAKLKENQQTVENISSLLEDAFEKLPSGQQNTEDFSQDLRNALLEQGIPIKYCKKENKELIKMCLQALMSKLIADIYLQINTAFTAEQLDNKLSPAKIIFELKPSLIVTNNSSTASAISQHQVDPGAVAPNTQSQSTCDLLNKLLTNAAKMGIDKENLLTKLGTILAALRVPPTNTLSTQDQTVVSAPSLSTTSTSSSTVNAIPQRQMDAGAVAPTTQPRPFGDLLKKVLTDAEFDIKLAARAAPFTANYSTKNQAVLSAPSLSTTSISSSTANAIPQRQMDAGAVAPTTQPASTPDRQSELRQIFIADVTRDIINKTVGPTHEMDTVSEVLSTEKVSTQGQAFTVFGQSSTSSSKQAKRPLVNKPDSEPNEQTGLKKTKL